MPSGPAAWLHSPCPVFSEPFLNKLSSWAADESNKKPEEGQPGEGPVYYPADKAFVLPSPGWRRQRRHSRTCFSAPCVWCSAEDSKRYCHNILIMTLSLCFIRIFFNFWSTLYLFWTLTQRCKCAAVFKSTFCVTDWCLVLWKGPLVRQLNWINCGQREIIRWNIPSHKLETFCSLYESVTAVVWMSVLHQEILFISSLSCRLQFCPLGGSNVQHVLLIAPINKEGGRHRSSTGVRNDALVGRNRTL